jgi:ribosomal protein L11 methyltransferase
MTNMAEKYWLEVSLIVNGELAEAVAEVLSRYIPDGVVIESTAVVAGPADENGQATGPLRVCGYIPADERLEDTRQKIEQGLWYLGRISTLPTPEFKMIQEINWMEAWKDHYHPIPIGQRLLILPSWINPTQHDRIPIRIELGMAFGTGTHPTTQLCLALVEDFFTHLECQPGLNVIDIGCGSGILSIAALKLGADKALGVDIDPEAVRASGDNAVLNGVTNQLELGIGSVMEVQAGKFGIQKAQLVLANILAPVLVKLLHEGLGELVLPDGWLILSGILAEQSPDVESALEEHGYKLVEKPQTGDWVAIAARRENF